MPNSIDYDFSFRADRENDRNPEDSIEPDEDANAEVIILDCLESETGFEHFENERIADAIYKRLVHAGYLKGAKG